MAKVGPTPKTPPPHQEGVHRTGKQSKTMIKASHKTGDAVFKEEGNFKGNFWEKAPSLKGRVEQK